MEINKKQQLKLMLTDLVGEGLLSLDEAAKLLKVSEAYLLDLIRRGKIKAFKVEEYWFVKFDWVEQFRQEIAQHLFSVIDQSDSLQNFRQKWIKIIKQKRKKLIFPPFFVISCRLITATFLLAMMTLSCALLIPFPEKVIIGKNYFLLKILSLTETSVKSIRYVSQLTTSSEKINDEKLTLWLRSFLNHHTQSGQVAGESEAVNE